VEHESFLQASHYGHFFLRKLSLPLYQRRRDDWKARMAAEAVAMPRTIGANTGSVDTPKETASRKRKGKEEEDVIDEVFAGKKVKVAESLIRPEGVRRTESGRPVIDAALDVVLGAIRASRDANRAR
jgi:nucleolar protein 9